MEFLSNSINQSGLNSALERIEEIEKLLEVNRATTNLGKERFNQIISQVANEHKVDPKLIEAVIEQESNFNPNAISKEGAIGLMQLTAGTARDMGVKDPLNPVENIRGGTKYLSSLLNRYQGNVILALSAYNAGPNNVDRYGGIPPYKETTNYVERVIKKLT